MAMPRKAMTPAEKQLRDRLYDAAWRGRPNEVGQLLALCQHKAKWLQSAFVAACRHGHAEVFDLLLPHTARSTKTQALEAIAERSDLARRSKHRAGEHLFDQRHLVLAKRLIEEGDCDPQNNESQALRWAVSRRHITLVKMLLPVSVPTVQESACLSMAADPGARELFDVLMPVSDAKAAWARLVDSVDRLQQSSAYPKNVLNCSQHQLRMLGEVADLDALRTFSARHPAVLESDPELKAMISARLLNAAVPAARSVTAGRMRL